MRPRTECVVVCMSVVAVDPVSEVLRDLQWSVTGVRRHQLRSGERRTVHPADTGFHFVIGGAVDVMVGAVTTRLVAGGFALLTATEGHLLKAHDSGAELLSGILIAHDGVSTAGVVPGVIIACHLLAEEPMVGPLLEAMEAELAGRRSGRAAIATRLANVVAAAAIRTWIESDCAAAGDAMVPLRDPYLARAIAAMHREPGAAWTVAGLAGVAASSRSVFADRFRAAVGVSPKRYLMRVRMQRATVMLGRDRLSVAETAMRLGYRSDAAFSRAFRRFAGSSPREWRRRAA
jgi:AraC-like DNA-binding protein